MIKGLLIYINILFLSAISFFSGAEVTASAVAPATVKQGESFEVTLTINKGAEVNGFSKIQFDLPADATVIPIDIKGGDLKVVANVLKIQWIGTPSTPSIVVKFKVTPTPQTTGTFNLTGTFSYILDGQRKDIYFNPLNIQISGSNVANNNTTTTPATTNSANTTTTATTNAAATTTPTNTTTQSTTTPSTSTNTTTTPTATSNGTPSTSPTNTATTNNTATSSVGKVSAKRTLSSNTVKVGESFTVEITVNKNNENGFAKIQDNLPTGFVAEEIESYGGQFSNEGEKAKILWMTIPSATTFKVKYKVTLNGVAKGSYKIDGFFSYMPDQQADVKVDLGVSEIKVVEENVAVNTPASEQTPVSSTNTEPAKTEPKIEKTANPKTNTAEKNTAVEVVEKEKPSKTSTTSPEAEKSTAATKNTSSTKSTKPTYTAPAVITNPGATNNNKELFYSVQICALKRATDVSYFETNHSVKEKIFVQMHEGWHKYTVGEFKVYKEARDHREMVKTSNKIVGPFVTAYNKGVRITVQEALMISGQQWVQ